MANYTKATNFTAKDALPTGNAGKIVKGAELDTEYTAIASAISSKADSNSPSFTGTPTAPTASAGTSTTQLATTAFATAAANAAFPVGGIIMWSGSIASIPLGWALCNGSNGTPDLRDRFVIGAGSTYAVNATGGAVTSVPSGSASGTSGGTAITEAQMPKHFHRTWGPPPIYTGGGVPGVDSPGTSYPGRGVFNGGTPDDGATDFGTWSVGGGAPSGGTQTGTGAASEHNHSISLSLASVSVSTLSPYFALAFIMRTA